MMLRSTCLDWNGGRSSGTKNYFLSIQMNIFIRNQSVQIEVSNECVTNNFFMDPLARVPKRRLSNSEHYQCTPLVLGSTAQGLNFI